MDRLAVVQTAFLGDIVLTTPLLREIKRARPGSSLTVVTTPLGRAVLSGHPSVDEIVVHDKRGDDRGPLGVARAVAKLRASRLDAVVVAQRSARSGLIARGSGARVRVGFSDAPGRWAYTDRVAWAGTEHAVRRYLALSGPIGGDPAAADPTPCLAVAEEARARIEASLAARGIGPREEVLAIAPGSIWGTKRWTPEGFAEVSRAAGGMGLRSVLVGAPEEAALCAQIARSGGSGAAVLAGATGPSELVALLSRARALVTGDSGPGHVASAVGTPVVAIFGPTVPAFGYTPWGERNRIVETDLPCRPCDHHGPRVCPLVHHRCMRDIPVSRVLSALSDALAQRARPG